MSRMKAVVVEIKGKHAAALSEDGRVRRLKNRGYAVGQQIDIRPPQSLTVKYAVRAACAAAVIMATGLSAYAYCTPYSYVSLDVNPSFEYSLNRFDRVLDCHALNGDGEEVLASLSLKNKSIEQAIEATLSQIASQGYFAGTDEGGIVIAASSPNEKKSEKLAMDIESAAKESVKESESKIEVKAESVSRELVEEANALGVTPGKLNLVEKLAQSETGQTGINREEWLDKPVKEILKQIQENKKENKEENKNASAAKEQTKETKENGGSKEESGKKPSDGASPNRKDQLTDNGPKQEDAKDTKTEARPENQKKDNNEKGRKTEKSTVKDKTKNGSSNSNAKTKKWFWPFG